MNEPIRIMIADDHPMFRKGLTMLLKSLPNFTVVAEAQDGASVVPLALQHQPDIILMDVQMPELNGIDATREIMRHSPHIRVLILTMFQNDEFLFSAMRAGARGYLLKGADQDELLNAIQTVSLGGAVFSPTIADRMIHYFAGIKPMQAESLFPELTEREVEVLDLIARGWNNTEIADKFCLSGKTVRNHVSNILHKLELADRAQAIVRAREAGLGTGRD
ncbi:MAG: response regulator transcription factor [Anaerolinea sp.]|nr:response regulator transcription factor [Anaerolinea sp.]